MPLPPRGLPQARDSIRAGGALLPPVRGPRMKKHEALTPLTGNSLRVRHAAMPGQANEEAGAPPNDTGDLQPSPSATAPRKQLSLKSKDTMTQLLAELKATTGQGDAPAVQQSAWEKFLDEQSLRVPAARIGRTPTPSGGARVSAPRPSAPSSRVSTPSQMPLNLRPKAPSTPEPDGTSQVARSPTRRRPLVNPLANGVPAAFLEPRSRMGAGPRTPQTVAGARRPGVGAVLQLRTTGVSPRQADAPYTTAAASAEEEITREGEVSASDGRQDGLARLPSQPTSPKLGQGFPALDSVRE